jgi:hypothetical protein
LVFFYNTKKFSASYIGIEFRQELDTIDGSNGHNLGYLKISCQCGIAHKVFAVSHFRVSFESIEKLFPEN